MTRSRIECAVARATGESLSKIKRLGFSLAEPAAGGCDDQAASPSVVDWDAMQQDRVSLFPNRQRVGVAVEPKRQVTATRNDFPGPERQR